MLRHAFISLVTALIAAVWGFSGIFPVTGQAGQILFFTATGFLVLSLLFSLFEEVPVAVREEMEQELHEQTLPLQPQPGHAHG